ncbi:hypothetical protein DDF62_17295 [Caulobacter radicis]|uniref:hypothetical protein n=1 Tax=Caulobacter radicis TaxID=2172650 RepID=UPI000D56C00C|nr:hypothetical protein [Caulobacter radicis]PVM86809.1 hypothetical protein DDF62_17295 [Caulobacter radicis]
MATLILAAALSACEPAPPPYHLLSLGALPLGANDYADRFDIETFGVEIVAVCRVPFGWVVSAGNDSSVTGTIVGQASVGAAAVSPANGDLDALGGLMLVKVGERQPGQPPPFAGQATIGTYGDDEAERTVPLTQAQLRLKPAYRCPPIPKARP